MSKFTVKPYIEKVLGEVSGENKAKLLNFINGKAANGSAAVSYTTCETVAEMAALTAGVHAVEYRFSSTITWKGYFIRTTNYKVFVTFKNGINLVSASVYEVDSGLALMEEVTADNIRALLREDSYIDVSELPEAGTKVEANPELAGTEATLTGIKIGNEKYKLNEPLYFHRIRIGSAIAGSATISLNIINKTPTPFTHDAIIEYVRTHGYPLDDRGGYHVMFISTCIDLSAGFTIYNLIVFENNPTKLIALGENFDDIDLDTNSNPNYTFDVLDNVTLID